MRSVLTINTIGLLYRTYAMRNRDCRSALSCGIQCILDDLFRLRVERGGGLVQEEYAWITEKRSRYSYPLLLPAREHAPSRAYNRRETITKRNVSIPPFEFNRQEKAVWEEVAHGRERMKS